MAVFAAFGDDSGSHAQSPMMILAVVVSEQESWKQFSDDWWLILTAARPLKAVNGRVYFRSSDAEALTGCFEGFTREEADRKVEALTDVVLKYIGYAMLSGIKWEHFRDIFQKGVPKPKGRLHNYFKHPYYMLFHDVVSSVCNMQLELGLKGEVDFVFDQQDKMLTRSIKMFEDAMPKVRADIRDLCGQVVPGDSKLVLPLQAADLVAWQTRSRSWPHAGRDTPSIRKLVASGKIYYTVINRGFLRYYAQWLNWTPATRYMIARFAGVPMTWPVRRHVVGTTERTEERLPTWIAPLPLGKVKRGSS